MDLRRPTHCYTHHHVSDRQRQERYIERYDDRTRRRSDRESYRRSPPPEAQNRHRPWRSRRRERSRSLSRPVYCDDGDGRRDGRRRRGLPPSYDKHPRRDQSADFEYSHRKRDRESENSERSRRDNDRKCRKRRRRRHDASSDSSHRQFPAEVSVEGEEAYKGNEKVSTKRSPSAAHDDTVGHFRGGPGALIDDRYRVIQQVGVGTFGRVVECLDLQGRCGGRSRDRRENYVAIKVVRKIKRYYESALIEARIIKDVNRRGGRGLSHCVILHDAFSFDGHYCMVFESLGPSLYDFMKKHDYRPFPMTCIQDFTVQLLETLEFLHGFRLVHTDLKVENFCLTTDREVLYSNQHVPASTRIKVIDFGGACYDDEKKSAVINTRQYRAPEVILQTGWSMPSDLWSAGCILAELYQGALLFCTHADLEHLALMESMISPFPDWMLKKSARMDTSSTSLVRKAFNSNDRHRLDAILSPQSASYVKKAPSLESIVRNPEDGWFLNLLRRILVIDPYERETAHEALRFLSRIGKNVVRNA